MKCLPKEKLNLFVMKFVCSYFQVVYYAFVYYCFLTVMDAHVKYGQEFHIIGSAFVQAQFFFLHLALCDVKDWELSSYDQLLYT